MMFTFDFIIPCSHPCLAGHFPGNIMVPGVIILDELMQGIISEYLSVSINSISSIKFHNPLQPDILVHVYVTKKNEDILNFICETNELLIANGQLRLDEARL